MMPSNSWTKAEALFIGLPIDFKNSLLYIDLTQRIVGCNVLDFSINPLLNYDVL